LQELQALARRRLKSARVNFAEGVETAREVRRDIEYSSKKMEYVIPVAFITFSLIFIVLDP
jgi:uncharacterized protein involved in cysteine biosynthesis